MPFIIFTFQLIILIFSAIIHEISHGFQAEKLGDPTARLAGRLTLNPLKHLDLFGSVILPLSLYFFSGGNFVFGWAKPVPYNPFNLKNPQTDAGKIAAAGPAANLIIAGIFGLILKIFVALNFFPIIKPFFGLIIYINILLAVFNLVPIPPLDGSKVLFAFLPPTKTNRQLMIFLERYGFILLLLFVFFGFNLIKPIINILYFIIAGYPSQ